MQNRVNGVQSPYTPRSSLGEYATGFVGGGASAAVLGGAGRVVGGVGAGVISLGQDRINGRSLDFGKAGITAATTVVAGSAFKGLVGASPLEKAALSSASQKTITQGLRYETSQSTLQSGVNAIAQSNYQMKSITTSSQGNASSYGGFGGVVNSLSQALSTFTKPLAR